VRHLWELSAQATGDPCFGLTVASFWHPTTLYALGYSWLASENLDEAFLRLVRYTSIVNTAAGGIFSVDKSPDCYKLVANPVKLFLPTIPVAADATTAMIVTMCRSAYGNDFRPLRVLLQHERPSCAGRFEELFRAPVEFDQPGYELWMDPRQVYEPLATANPDLVRINDQIVTDYLAQLDRSDVTSRVRSKLIERLPDGNIGEEEIASALNLSLRSLQRKLKAQDVSFKQLLDDTRRDLGLQYVRNPHHSLIEIAFLLGFAEPGNFTRAFKRWYGMSPSKYRQQLLAVG
jgi:AraC-like DNA-binding protein